jgi:DNA-binding MltR family transcriptional regulator
MPIEFRFQFTEAQKQLIGHLDRRLLRSINFGETILAESQRGSALVAAAFLDELLLELVQAHMIERAKSNKFAFFFEGFGPLASFAARTHTAYLLGFIDKSLHSDLCLVRDIRNKFAHQSLHLDFRDAEISAWCSQLHYYVFARYDEHPQTQFLVSVIALVMMIDTLILEGPRLAAVSDWPADVAPELERRAQPPNSTTRQS